MIASWMLYAVIVGLLASAAAALCDRVLRGLRLPTRGVWVAALVFSVAWPVVAMFVSRDAVAPTAQPVASTPLIGATLQRITIIATRSPSAALPVSVDAIALAFWVACSLFFGMRLVRDVRSLAARRAVWANGDVDGVRIRLSHDTGPGVVGLNPMEVVFPSWALGLDTPLRSLVLRHEEEHRRARDPFLLAFATVLFVLLPWNVGVWWQARRLRLAVELDCDARVLGAEPHPERYGLLLLTIAQRRSHGLARLITSLLEPAQHLGERITAMQSPSRPVSRMRAVLFASLAAGFVVLACTMNAPRDPVSPSAVARARADSGFIEIPVGVRYALDSTRYTLDKLRYVIDSLEYVIDRMRQLEVKTRIDSLAVDIRPLLREVRIDPRQVDVRPLMIDVKPLSIDTKPLQVDVKPVIVETKPLIVDVKPAQVRVRPDTIPLVVAPAIVPITGEFPVRAGSRVVIPPTVETVKIVPPSIGGTQQVPARWEFQVHVPARWIQGTGSVKYPQVLRDAGIQGKVIAQYVVDETGRADMNTFKILTSSHELFSESVRNATPTRRYESARLSSGEAVRQIVQQEFVFSIAP